MNHKKIAVLCVPLLLAFLLTGCANKTATAPLAADLINKPHPHQTKPASDPNGDGADSQNVDADEHANEDLQISSPQDADPDTKPSASQDGQDSPSPAASDKQTRVNRSFDVNEPYDARKPSLMGFTVNDEQTAVVNRFGKPTLQYVIDEDYDPITVYDYPGFSVGFDKTKHLKFVEVHSNEVNPGLNGFRLGNTVNDAIKALGMPQSNTQFVISYRSGGVILKMDVDPSTHLIQSIKLFAENR